MCNNSETIAAISTPPGIGGIAVIRISGKDSVPIINGAWKGKDLTVAPSHTVHLGKYISTEGYELDECVATIFRAPHSFTGEDVVELSVHGSKWIQREIINDIIRRGGKIASPGEFTMRAFMNRKLDLAQAEGIADLISSSSRAAHKLALSQTRGSFSKSLETLRERLIEFSSLLELELDFSEEDVEFADRGQLIKLAETIDSEISRLAESYSIGAAIKEGINIVIAGVPNAGKSSLLNMLVNDDKAIVSHIPGTTRDLIEDTAEIGGILFRFIDTAGIHESDDFVENLGMERTRKSFDKAYAIIWVLDSGSPLSPQLEELKKLKGDKKNDKLIILANKTDLLSHLGKESLIKQLKEELKEAGIKLQENIIEFSTKTGEGHEKLLNSLQNLSFAGNCETEDVIVTNARHYESLTNALQSLVRAKEGIESGISADFIAQDIRETLHHLGTITGSITTEDLLQNIFANFCIGK